MASADPAAKQRAHFTDATGHGTAVTMPRSPLMFFQVMQMIAAVSQCPALVPSIKNKPLAFSFRQMFDVFLDAVMKTTLPNRWTYKTIKNGPFHAKFPRRVLPPSIFLGRDVLSKIAQRHGRHSSVPPLHRTATCLTQRTTSKRLTSQRVYSVHLWRPLNLILHHF
nr:uncharacterized protein LOC129380595 isoform X2 [Dermacentor andersoni]